MVRDCFPITQNLGKVRVKGKKAVPEEMGVGGRSYFFVKITSPSAKSKIFFCTFER